MNKELEEVFKRLDLFKLDMNKNIEDIYHRLYITFDDNEISYLLEYIKELEENSDVLVSQVESWSKTADIYLEKSIRLQKENEELQNKIDKHTKDLIKASSINERLHNKIDKAIKFIEDEAYVDYEMEMSHNLYEGEIFELLKILKGDVDE